METKRNYYCMGVANRYAALRYDDDDNFRATTTQGKKQQWKVPRS